MVSGNRGVALVRISAVVDERGRPVMIGHRCPVFENEFLHFDNALHVTGDGNGNGRYLQALEILMMD